MTAAQSTALEQISELMREHFDSSVFIFETDARVDNDPTLCQLSYRIGGSPCTALGLVEYARHKILNDE